MHKPPGRKPRDPSERFFAHVVRGPSCWTWDGSKRNGYGLFNIGSNCDGSRRVVSAHRFAYQLRKGPIPDGLTLDHLCRNRSCVNPDHHEPVTAAENVARSARVRTHCKHGHEFTPENTRMYRGARVCRTCHSRTAHVARAPRPRVAKTHCAQGHAFTAANTYVAPRGSRECKTCRTAIMDRYRERNGLRPSGQRKTHCKQGHEFTPENTLQNARDGRVCRECARSRALAWYHRTRSRPHLDADADLHAMPHDVGGVEL